MENKNGQGLLIIKLPMSHPKCSKFEAIRWFGSGSKKGRENGDAWQCFSHSMIIKFNAVIIIMTHKVN